MCMYVDSEWSQIVYNKVLLEMYWFLSYAFQECHDNVINIEPLDQDSNSAKVPVDEDNMTDFQVDQSFCWKIVNITCLHSTTYFSI